MQLSHGFRNEFLSSASHHIKYTVKLVPLDKLNLVTALNPAERQLNIYRVAVSMLLFILCDLAHSVDKKGEYTVLSFGTKSCVKVLADFDEDGHRKLANSTWVGGYLTAVNKYAFQGKDVTAGTDSDQRMLWIVNFCKGSPLESLEGATAALVVELRKRAR